MRDSLEPEWLPGGRSYRIREITMFCVYGLYTVFVFATMTMFLLQSRNAHSELSKRSVILVTLQATGAFMVGTVGLVSSAIIDWSCFFKLWLLSIGLTLLMTAIAARAVQLIVVSKIHSLNNQLVRSNPQFIEKVKGELLGKFSSAQRSQGDAGGFINKSFLDDAIKESKALMDANKNSKVLKDLDRYIKLQPYIADRFMVVYICCALVLICVMTIVISVVNKDFSLNPMNIACELVWGFVPMYAIACAFLAIICPVLLFITWGLKEAYGIRKDLIICVTSGIVGSILMIIWEFKFPQFDDIWSDLFFVWDYAFLIHIFSVVVPLWHATRHMRKLDHHLRSESPGSTSTVTLMKSEDAVSSEPALPTRVVRFEEKVIKHKEYGKFRQAFVHVLDDPALYAQFRDFSCACFCSELISFIDEYQTLKVLTLIALGQHEYSAEPVYRAYNTPLMQSPMSAMFVVPEDGNHSDSIADLPRNVNLSKLHNSVTVGILEAAKEIYPDRGFNHATMFPPALMDTLVMIFSTYINSSSPTAVNVPQIMIRRIQEKLNKNQLYLTILDDVKDEVLYMLYLNVFTRFSS